MAETFAVDILSPARAVLSSQAESVIIPGSEGQFTAMPRHAPMIAALGMDVLTVMNGGKGEAFFVAGGTVDVRPEGVTVLADEAIAVADIKLDEINARIAVVQTSLAAAASLAQREYAQRTLDKLSAMKALASA